MRIITEKRSNDWIAYLDKVPVIWESGKDEFEAIGKLIVSLRAWGGSYQVRIEYLG